MVQVGLVVVVEEILPLQVLQTELVVLVIVVHILQQKVLLAVMVAELVVMVAAVVEHLKLEVQMQMALGEMVLQIL